MFDTHGHSRRTFPALLFPSFLTMLFPKSKWLIGTQMLPKTSKPIFSQNLTKYALCSHWPGDLEGKLSWIISRGGGVDQVFMQQRLCASTHFIVLSGLTLYNTPFDLLLVEIFQPMTCIFFSSSHLLPSLSIRKSVSNHFHLISCKRPPDFDCVSCQLLQVSTPGALTA
jgi:hypothetical protein